MFYISEFRETENYWRES